MRIMENKQKLGKENDMKNWDKRKVKEKKLNEGRV